MLTDDEKYFYARTRRAESGCLLWTGAAQQGYGVARHQGKKVRAHRLAFYVAHGRWPEPMALHRCDVRNCVEISHLFEGDHAANMADRNAKGRQARQKGESHGGAKLTENQVRRIRAARATIFELAERFGISFSMVARIRRREGWRHVS